MARISWLDDDTSLPLLEERLQSLQHFTDALADGVVDSGEVARAGEAVSAAMRAVEGELSDEQHGKVTSLLVELTAYNILTTLHELAGERVRKAFG